MPIISALHHGTFRDDLTGQTVNYQLTLAQVGGKHVQMGARLFGDGDVNCTSSPDILDGVSTIAEAEAKADDLARKVLQEHRAAAAKR